MLLSRYDYISLAEESDFYVVELTADENEGIYYDQFPRIRQDALELRWFEGSTSNKSPQDPKISSKASITLRFHDGALAGTKLHLDSKSRYTLGSSPQSDVVIPDSAGRIAKSHAVL